jgi:serine phosphatase RsbU (regulator of sigma subunit)
VAVTPLAIGIAARPYPGETVSGDGWSIERHGNTCRIALIDGLGHGPAAAAATTRATEELRARPALSPADALMLCHAALRGLRGAAISVARLDLGASRLTYAGIGNVEARLLQGAEESRLISYRGIVGSSIPTIRSFELALGTEWLLLLHTDGVRNRFDLRELMEQPRGEPQAIADAVLQQWGRQTDDATVIAMRPNP